MASTERPTAWSPTRPSRCTKGSNVLRSAYDRIRRTMHVEPWDKGMKLTVQVIAYDNGMVSVDGVPINNIKRDKDASAHGWLGAAETAVLTISEFRRQVEKRQHS